MNWLYTFNKAIKYLEDNLENKVSLDDVSDEVFYSSSHFQRIFNLTTGITIGEYLRNRRLSLAGQDLLEKGSKVIDIAYKYQYDTPESFSKAFYRFHGIKPNQVKKDPTKLKFFGPLTINISVHGGFDMVNKLVSSFYWNDFKIKDMPDMSDEDKYQAVVKWALEARRKNPQIFDTLTEWVLDDSEWDNDEKIFDNEQIFINGVIARFIKQNQRLRALLKELEPSGVVNPVVFTTLDSFDNELLGHVDDSKLVMVVTKVLADFSEMRNKDVRKMIGGSKTGPTGTDSVEIFGYVNRLKECDAAVQWALFMPDYVKRQQKGFKIETFEYKKMPSMRFIGFTGEEYRDDKKRLDKMNVLKRLTEYKSEIEYDILLVHHNGLGVDVAPPMITWGRFMAENTPVPDGFVYYDFLENPTKAPGAPYFSEFAFSTFSGDMEAMHQTEGYDVDAMYDVTRNIILAQGVCIPYPRKYWTAEVYIDGCDHECTGYMFSIKK